MHPRDPITRRSVTVSRFESRSLTGNSASEQETAVPPKSKNETRTPHTPLISDEFVSVQKVVAAEVAQRPGMCGGIRTSEKDKNMRYINILIRGGGCSPDRTGLHGQIPC